MVVAHTSSSVWLLPSDNLKNILVYLLWLKTLDPLLRRNCLRRENTLSLNVAGTYISLLLGQGFFLRLKILKWKSSLVSSAIQFSAGCVIYKLRRVDSSKLLQTYS